MKRAKDSQFVVTWCQRFRVARWAAQLAWRNLRTVVVVVSAVSVVVVVVVVFVAISTHYSLVSLLCRSICGCLKSCALKCDPKSASLSSSRLRWIWGNRDERRRDEEWKMRTRLTSRRASFLEWPENGTSLCAGRKRAPVESDASNVTFVCVLVWPEKAGAYWLPPRPLLLSAQ